MKKQVKKGSLWLVSALSVLALAACSNQASEATSSTSQTSEVKQTETTTSTSTTSSSSQEEKKVETKKVATMNVTELVNGRFESVKGTWQDESGNRLTFDDTGLVSSDEEFYGVSATDYGTAAGGVYGGASGGYLIEFIPAGITIESRSDDDGTLLFADDSDKSRDRIWTGIGMQSFMEAGHFYYRVSE